MVMTVVMAPIPYCALGGGYYVITGGSMPSSGSMLLKLRELQAAEQELALEEQRLDDINQKISQMEKVNKQQGGLVQERERMVHALELLRNRVKNSSSAQVGDLIPLKVQYV